MRHDEPIARATSAAADDGERGPTPTDAALRRIATALHGLRFGSVTVIVQDGVVVQIERLEKTRFTR